MIAVRFVKFALLPLLGMSSFHSETLLGQTALDPKHMTTVSKLADNPHLKTSTGKDLVLLTFPYEAKAWRSSDAKYRFFIQGGLHGNEKLTSSFVMWLANRFAKGTSLLNNISNQPIRIDFLPIANPDGYKTTYRYNQRDVNLNRNFGVLWGLSRENPGTASFSEPETQSIRYLFQEAKYTAAIDVHGYVNWIVAPSPIADENNAKGTAKWYQTWVDTLKDNLKKFSFPYEVKTASELGDGGAFEDWVAWSAGVPAACLEMHSADRFVKRSHNQITDTFLEYESYIASVFKRAIEQGMTQSH